MAWWVRHWTSMPRDMVPNPAKVRLHSTTRRQWKNSLLPDCIERGSIGAQNVQHLEILRWRFNLVLSPAGNVRLVKLCEYLLQLGQNYKLTPLLIPLSMCCNASESILSDFCFHFHTQFRRVSFGWAIGRTPGSLSHVLGIFSTIVLELIHL